MESMLVMQTAAVILTVSAVGGIAMALIRFTAGTNPPAWLAMLHGMLSASAVTLLLYASFTTGLPPLAHVALVLFLLAAAGGATLNLGYHWKSLQLPTWLVITHAVVAVAGFLCLLVAVFARPA
jgi:uncharacterized membrane protein HdeD (DUF308 family)